MKKRVIAFALAAGVVLGGGVAATAVAATSTLGTTGGQVSVPGAEYEHITETATVVHNGDRVVKAHCSEGFVPISGGVESPTQTPVLWSYPDFGDNSWVAQVQNPYPDAYFTVHAVCVKFTE